MKQKSMRKILAAGLALGMALSLGACGNSMQSGGSGDSGGELQSLGYLSASWSDDYCKRLSDAIVELGPEYGFKVNALNGAPDGNPDVSKYMEGIDALLAQNPDAMMVQPLFTIPDYCMQFNGKIPLTFVNIAPEISDASADLEYWYAGCYDTDIGAQLAEEMAKGLKDGAKICMINLTYGQTNAIQRDEGFKNWMAENRPDVEIIETHWVEKIDTQNAQSAFEDWVQKYGVGGFDGVASQSGMLTQGVVECMKNYGLDTSNFIVAGISASTTEWIREDLEYVELYQDPYAEARAALETARAQMDGTTGELETLEGTDNVVSVPMTPITKENVEEFDW